MPQPVSVTFRKMYAPSGSSSSMYIVLRQCRSAWMIPVHMVMTPLSSPMASDAFMMRFITTCLSCVASAATAGRLSARSHLSETFFEIAVSHR